MKLSSAILLLGLLLASCSGGEAPEPRWVHLARGFQPAPADAVIRGWTSEETSVRPEGTGIWIETALPRPVWRPGTERADEWSAARPANDALPHRIGERVELRVGGRALPQIEYLARRDRDTETGDGLFYVSNERVFLRLPDGTEPPEQAVFAYHLERGREVGGTWRAIVGDTIADGISVWPGERVELELDLPAGSVLRLQTAAHAIAAEGRVRFRVSLDGAPLLDHEALLPIGGDEHHVLPLPPRGSPDARLELRVDGAPATTAFLNPVVGPAEVGRPGARPWSASRPDAILFLADTFRADLLAPWGGDPEVAPDLNRLAERSVRFLNARSTSVWTLPSHASLFTGLQPLQHGAVVRQATVPEELLTLAEQLAAHGYRTGAITDSGFVSRFFAMDQGFEWFEETAYADRDLRRTLARASEFLDRDDGRPVFLFVHTYRTHQPYRSGPEEDTTAFFALMGRIRQRLQSWDRGGDVVDVLREYLDEFHGLYLDGARALDAQLGPWTTELEERGVLGQGYFVFTSDHGDEFLEHGRHYHKGAPHEEKIRVPLLLHGPDLEPRDVSVGASLIDVAPTLAELCRVPAPDAWVGSSLLRLERERPLVALNVEDGRSLLAIVEGSRKIFSDGTLEALRRGELTAAYDLESDPGEQENLVGGDADWPREMGAALAPLWEEISIPLGEAGSAELTSEMRARLRELGYVE